MTCVNVDMRSFNIMSCEPAGTTSRSRQIQNCRQTHAAPYIKSPVVPFFGWGRGVGLAARPLYRPPDSTLTVQCGVGLAARPLYRPPDSTLTVQCGVGLAARPLYRPPDSTLTVQCHLTLDSAFRFIRSKVELKSACLCWFFLSV